MIRHVNQPESLVQAGVARVDITPPVGTYHRMWGAATHDRSTGVHRPLTATALALAPRDVSRGPTWFVVAVDHCLLGGRELKLVLDRIVKRTGVAIENVLLTFSHTHGAGLMSLDRAALPGGDLIAPYLEALADRLSDAILEARRKIEPAVVRYAAGHCSLARNRDLWDATSDQFVCGFNPSGPSDDTILVASITRDDGAPLATVVNYACHPTTLAWDNTLISPDYIGAMREVVEPATSSPCIFLQGASGDLGPREGFVGDVAVADRNGRQLGHAVLSAIESLAPVGTRYEYRGPVVSGATIGVWQHRPREASERLENQHWSFDAQGLELPLRPDLPTKAEAEAGIARWSAKEQECRSRGDDSGARDCRAQVERMTRWLFRLQTLPEGKTATLPIVVWRLGEAAWVFLESEHYQVLQVELRRRFPRQPMIVTTIVNGSTHTYLCPKEAYGKGLYQESVAVFAAGSLEQLIDELDQRLFGLGCPRE